jgi:hypothetical protein
VENAHVEKVSASRPVILSAAKDLFLDE